MDNKKQGVLTQLERMREQAQKNVERDQSLYFIHSYCALSFAKTAIEVLTENDKKEQEIRAEAVADFVERLKEHYPHSDSIISTINKEFAKFVRAGCAQ